MLRAQRVVKARLAHKVLRGLQVLKVLAGHRVHQAPREQQDRRVIPVR